MQPLSGRQWLWSLAFGLLAFAALWLQFPILRIADGDASAYILGANSLRRGLGYVDTNGWAINNFWPVGYSFLLAQLPGSVQAAQWVNYLSFGISVTCFLALLLARLWHPLLAICLTVALSFGFLSDLASNAKPDILCYAAFLSAMLLWRTSSVNLRCLGGVICGALVPIKLVAVTLVPALVIGTVMASADWRQRLKQRDILLALATLSLATLFVIAYNHATLTNAFTANDSPTVRNTLASFVGFFPSIFRRFLANWNGTLRQFPVLAAFAAVSVAGIMAFSTMRQIEDRSFAYTALAFFLLAICLRLAKKYDTDARLLGYGLLLVILAAGAPPISTYKRWSLYAVLALSLALVYAQTQSDLGVNHPSLKALAMRLKDLNVPRGPYYSNSAQVLDVHTDLATIPVTSASAVPNAALLLYIHDYPHEAITTPVWPLSDFIPKEWCQVASTSGAEFLRRCALVQPLGHGP